MAKVTPIAAVVAAVALVVLAGVQVFGLVASIQTRAEAQALVDEVCSEVGIDPTRELFDEDQEQVIRAALLDSRWQELSDAFSMMDEYVSLLNIYGLENAELEERYPDDYALFEDGVIAAFNICRAVRL